MGFSSKGANDAGAKQNKTITTYAVRKPLIKLGVTPRKLLAILNDDGSDVRRNETADFENNKQVGSTRVKCSDSCDFFVAKVCELSPLGGVSKKNTLGAATVVVLVRVNMRTGLLDSPPRPAYIFL